jgi:hypothetical protein
LRRIGAQVLAEETVEGSCQMSDPFGCLALLELPSAERWGPA